MKEEGNRKRSLKILEPEAVLISTEIIERLATGDATVEDLHAASSAPQSSLSMPPKSLAVTCQHPSSGRVGGDGIAGCDGLSL